MWGVGIELVELAKAGDEAAFRELVEPYRAELHAHCYRMLGSVQDAEDALQETLLAAWRGLAGFEQRASVRAVLDRPEITRFDSGVLQYFGLPRILPS